MPDFSLTDNLGNPVDGVKVDWTSLSSIFKYAKTELLHLAVAPDFLACKDQPLSEAAPNPIRFDLKVGNDFQLGDGTQPEIDLAPGAEASLVANTTQGSSLIVGDPFHAPATVPANTGYVGIALTGSLSLGLGASDGNLTFGINKGQLITFAFYKAFTTDTGQPTLATATGQTLSGFVIPASLSDLQQLQVNDVCSASGQGTLMVSGSFNISAFTNALASVNLPMGVGPVEVQDGLMAGVSASFSIAGPYQIRARKLDTDRIELSYLKERASILQVAFDASAGASVMVGGTDLLPSLLGAIAQGGVDKAVLAGLTDDETAAFNAAIQQGVNHSLKASLDLALSSSTDDQATFQYEIQPSLLDAAGQSALNRALKGDLSKLTALEATAQANGTIAPGIRLLNSALTQMRANGISMKVNLLGIVNLLSLSKLIRNCEILTEPVSGDIVIKETIQSERISAITEPFNQQDALRKALFDSVLLTTTYVASKAVTLPSLQCENLHFAANENTNKRTIADYLNWFIALKLADENRKRDLVSQYSGGGQSTCLMRVQLDDAACEALFFDSRGNLRSRPEYLEIGREAMMTLLDPDNSDIDGYRRNLLSDPVTWSKALGTGPSPELRSLLPLSSTDSRLPVVLNDVIDDIYDIKWWADSMTKAGKALNDVRNFVGRHDPSTLAADPAFDNQRTTLQDLMSDVAKDSKVRFSEPWGMVCLFLASGSRQAYGKLTASNLALELPAGQATSAH
jgi:hypothetical protein